MLAGMRKVFLFALAVSCPFLAQAQPGPVSATCNVAPGPLDVDVAGELVRSPPTEEACERALMLQAKFLETSPRDFRLVRNMGRLPDPVRSYIAGIDAVGDRGSPVQVQVGRPTAPLQGIVVWLGTELVVLAYRTADLAGAATTVVLADLDSLNACAYLRWRGGALPATLSIDEIQAALDRGRLGTREMPVCSLRLLPID